MAKGNYNNAVLIGNWSEERLKNEYDFKLFLRKRDRRELLLQRSRILFSNLLKERTMAISGAYVLYGYNAQIVATDIPVFGGPGGAPPRYGLALSSLVLPREVDFIQQLSDGCLMTLSAITTPCCRNTFVILSTNPNIPRGEKVKYGDEIILKAENYGDPEAPPLFVRYTPAAAPSPADRLPVSLSAARDTNCRWTAAPLLRSERLERLGSPIKVIELHRTGEKILFKNCVADKNLCVMNQKWMQTFFGYECGVTCRNTVNSFGNNTAENVFTFVSDVPTKSKS